MAEMEFLEQLDSNLSKFEYMTTVRDLFAAGAGTTAAMLWFLLYHGYGRLWKTPMAFDFGSLILIIGLTVAFHAMELQAARVLPIRLAMHRAHKYHTWGFIPNVLSASMLLAIFAIVFDRFDRCATEPEFTCRDQITSLALAMLLLLAAALAHGILAAFLERKQQYDDAILDAVAADTPGSLKTHIFCHALTWLGPVASVGAGWLLGDLFRPLAIVAIKGAAWYFQPFILVAIVGVLVLIHVAVLIPFLVFLSVYATASFPRRAPMLHEMLSVLVQAAAASLGWVVYHAVAAVIAPVGTDFGGRAGRGLIVLVVGVVIVGWMLVRVRQDCEVKRHYGEQTTESLYYTAMIDIYADPAARAIFGFLVAAVAVCLVAPSTTVEAAPQNVVGPLLGLAIPITIVWAGGAILMWRCRVRPAEQVNFGDLEMDMYDGTGDAFHATSPAGYGSIGHVQRL